MSVARPLLSFGGPFDAVVAGAGGGIGQALVAALLEDPSVRQVLALARRPLAHPDPRVTSGHLDLGDENSIIAAAALVSTLAMPRLIIVATGLLHDATLAPEKSLRELDGARLARSFAVNAIGPALVIKHFATLLPRSGKTVIAALSARVGSIGDNRKGGWYGYRASKAALNQLLRTAAIEIGRSRPEAIVLGLHPGTVATDLSRPYTVGYTANAVFSADESARHLIAVIDGASVEASGSVLAWDGESIPP